MKNITILKKDLCTGCGACYNICPFNAIKMEYDNEGFLYPIIDKEKCTNCSKCIKACPQIDYKLANKKANISYAMMANDEIRKKSSSGGIFTLLAESVINEGGYVIGASFSDDFKSVKHIIINSINKLEKLKKSKYLQSDTNTTYKETRTLLDENKIVLYTGTPCQIAGLKNYLKKDYENLYTLDIVCHGTPSPKAWEKYLDEICKNKSVVDADFRNKICAWNAGSLLTLSLSDNSVIKSYSNENIYYKAFLQNLILRKSCATCNYTNITRTGDLTLGDFWGIEQYNKKLSDKKGTSLILINNKKGETLINKIKKNLKLNKKVPIKYAIKGNPVLKIPCKTHLERERFFKDFNNKSFSQNVNDCLDNTNYDGILSNMWYGDNVGANLTAFAIQQYFKNYNLDYRYANCTGLFGKRPIAKEILDFRNKHLKFTFKIDTLKGLKLLNQSSNTFVVGSDQVFRYPFIQDIADYFLFTYTDFSKKRVAFSASFGIDKFNETSKMKKYEFSKALKRFDYISTRESSGVDLCKNEFNIEAQHIFDPVFLIEKEKYEEIIEESNINCENKILSFVLDENQETDKILDNLSKKYNLPIEKLNFRNGVAPADFLKAIKEAKYIVTDSFHGACFSIIYHKQFICLINKNRGKARFDSLIKSFEINDSFVENASQLENKINFFEDIDWKKIDDIIEKEKQKAKVWFEKVFLTPKEITQEKFAIELDYLNKYIENTQPTSSFCYNKISFLKTIFSVKNTPNKKHKIITIMGIKFKIKRK